MHFTQQLLLFYAVSVHGFSLRDRTSLFRCISNCLNDTCLDACNDILDESIGELNADLERLDTFDNLDKLETDIVTEYFYPQVNEDTRANVDLHCTGENLMMIKFNPGIYIIQQSLSESVWSFAKLINGSLATFTNLTAGTSYRFRLYNVTYQGVARPEITDWFTTYEANYEPLPVKHITLLTLLPDETNECYLRAEIAFEPAEDRSCNYNVLAWNGEYKLWNFHLEKVAEFRFELNNLEFDQTNNVSISSVNTYDTVTSPRIFTTFYTHTCLEYYDNLSICAPEIVKGLQAESIYRDGELYDLTIYWNKTSLEPDNYTIQIDLLGDDDELYVLSVPGNKTKVSISNLKLGPRYAVSIVADSLGGTSFPETIVKNLVGKHATATNESYREIVIGITLSVTIVVLIGMVSLQYYKRKEKEFSMKCARFESSNQKDQSIEITKKLLQQDYDFDVNSLPLVTLTHDKFELRPELLKIKDVLGSGAYGVVRLGALQDKFDNVTDVAVKMLKDNPSVEDVNNFHKEITIMKFVGQHPNVVSLIGCCNKFNKPVLVVEYCCKGDLQTYLRTMWQSMMSTAFNSRARSKSDANIANRRNDIEYVSNNSDQKEKHYENIHMITNRLYDIQQDISQHTEIVTDCDLLNFARQIATGMEFLSSNRIVHCDLAARNILVCADRIVKISDFGLSQDVYQENLYRKKGNSKLPLRWMAIEALTHQIYTTHSDVWSFGILFWEIINMGALPYPGIHTNALLKLLKSGYRMERPLSCNVKLYNIMFSCWDTRPQNRPTFTQLRESLDKLLSYHSDIKYLNMDQMLS